MWPECTTRRHPRWRTGAIAVLLGLCAPLLAVVPLEVTVRDWPATRAAWASGDWGHAWLRLTDSGLGRHLPDWHRQPAWLGLVRYQQDLTEVTLALDLDEPGADGLLAADLVCRDADAAQRSRWRMLTARAGSAGPPSDGWQIRHQGARLGLGPIVDPVSSAAASPMAWRWGAWTGSLDPGAATGRVHLRGPPVFGSEPLPPDLVHRLPGTTLAVLAWSTGGATWQEHLGNWPIGPWDEDFSSQGTVVPTLRHLLALCDGPMILVLTRGSYQPGLSLGLPRSPALDRLIATLAGDRAEALTRADRHAVPFAVARGLEALFVRQVPGRWWLSTDLPALERMIDGSVATVVDEALLEPSPLEPLLQAPGDRHAVAAIDVDRSFAALARFRHLADIWHAEQAMRALEAIAASANRRDPIPPLHLVGTLHQGQTAMRIDDGALGVVSLLALHRLLQAPNDEIPPVGSFLQLCAAHGRRGDHVPAGGWPTDTAEVDDHDWLAEQFHFFPHPGEDPDRLWPILISHPRRYHPAGSFVCFADGRIAWSTDQTIWDHAADLSLRDRLPLQPWRSMQWRLARCQLVFADQDD